MTPSWKLLTISLSLAQKCDMPTVTFAPDARLRSQSGSFFGASTPGIGTIWSPRELILHPCLPRNLALCINLHGIKRQFPSHGLSGCLPRSNFLFVNHFAMVFVRAVKDRLSGSRWKNWGWRDTQQRAKSCPRMKSRDSWMKNLPSVLNWFGPFISTILHDQSHFFSPISSSPSKSVNRRWPGKKFK